MRTFRVALAAVVRVPVPGRRLHDKAVAHELLGLAPEGVRHAQLLACTHLTCISVCMGMCPLLVHG
jgi:hypothetical protein